MSTIYVAGHKSPDLDSVVGTIAYAHFKTQIDEENTYIPVRAGELNAETKYVLDAYNISTPELLVSIAGKEVILVDHNEQYQAIDGLAEAKVLEVIDHHKMDFAYSEPIRIVIEPIGSSSSVIAKMFRADSVEIPKNLAGAMLAAVLVDTVITKSPTTTKEDISIIKRLAQIAGVVDWKAYGMELFKVRSSVSDLSDEQIIVADYKDFDINGKKFGIGQVETVDMGEFEKRKEGLLKALSAKKKEGSYHSVILFISDIIAETSLFLVVSDDSEAVAKAFGARPADDTFTAAVLSRKKQVVPTLLEHI